MVFILKMANNLSGAMDTDFYIPHRNNTLLNKISTCSLVSSSRGTTPLVSETSHILHYFGRMFTCILLPSSDKCFICTKGPCILIIQNNCEMKIHRCVLLSNHLRRCLSLTKTCTQKSNQDKKTIFVLKIKRMDNNQRMFTRLLKMYTSNPVHFMALERLLINNTKIKERNAGFSFKERIHVPNICSEEKSRTHGKSNYCCHNVKRTFKNQKDTSVPKQDLLWIICNKKISWKRCRSILSMVILFSCLMSVNSQGRQDNGVTVNWKLIIHPVTFGESAILQCNVTGDENTCSMTEYQQWYGGLGDNYKLLCRGMKCRNETKYSAYSESACIFLLEIHNFSETDVDKEYSCYYMNGYERYNLWLNERDFQYIPNRDEIFINKTVSTLATGINLISVIVVFTRVFPHPLCNITFQAENISGYSDILLEERGIFYHMIYNLSYHPAVCPGLLKMECKIGNTLIVSLNETIVTCPDTNSNSTSSYLWILIVIGAAILVGLIIYVFFKKFKIYMRNVHSTTSEFNTIPADDPQ